MSERGGLPTSSSPFAVDVRFNCELDSSGRDPDSFSPTLRRSHQIMWSKALPSGLMFNLDISGPRPFLVHDSEGECFRLSSDSISHTYGNRASVKPFIEQLPEEMQEFVEHRGWQLCESIVFPGDKPDGKMTINGARGCHRRIGDRFDLTLECIRRHYLGTSSPLTKVLERNAAFFRLFGDFHGYVEFFLLQDLVDQQMQRVCFLLPFDEFERCPLPGTFDEYQEYVLNVMKFAELRAQRMEAWLAGAEGTL